MKSQDIRESFLRYFKHKEHKVFESSSLIPENDPTLLFTVAGMVQFKPMFAGLVNFDFKRATSIQKCLRVVDIEEVGSSPFHNTFFEMLGNFSFNDYFQKEAIEFAWDYLVNILGIDKSKLYVSVHKDDINAYNIWKNIIGLDNSRIIKMSDKTNFWGPAGGTGACGPSSEIFYDFGKDLKNKTPCSISNECKRYVEIWNLVFPQYNQDKDGKRHALKNKGVDTGMGLERLTAVLQNKKSIFQTDLFKPIIDAFIDEYSIDYEKYYKDVNSIADHIRALTFAIADGIIPSNEGRGYVIRRVLRRAVRLAYKMGIEKPFLYKLSSVVVDIMNEQYKYLSEEINKVSIILKEEEKRFLNTIGQGISMYETYKEKSGSIIKAEYIFKLYDTFGFPVDLTEQMAKEDGFEIDKKGFEKLLEQTKKVSRKSSVFVGDSKGDWIVFEDDVSQFIGYENNEIDSDILMYRIYDNNAIEIISRYTPFYGESGGQVGDTGIIKGHGLNIKVKNTYSSNLGNVMVGEIINGSIEKGKKYSLTIDKYRRHLTMRNHTATHILHAALRELLGDHVKQEGSYVGPDKLRFDFTHFKELNKIEIKEIEDKVNRIIFEAIPLNYEIMDFDDAIKKGAKALFREKYEKKVRVVSISDYSSELCGGTHVKNTAHIGIFTIVQESSIAAGIRRIEAFTSENAYKHLKDKESILEDIENVLKIKNYNKVLDRVNSIIDENKNIKHKLNIITDKLFEGIIEQFKPETINNNNYICKIFSDGIFEISHLRKLMDILKSHYMELTGTLCFTDNNNLLCLVFTQNNDKDASKILKSILSKINGKGGGKKELATGKGEKPKDIIDFENTIKGIMINDS